ncbi:hypothetical protein ACG02S_07975 [Roseateles sp. DC23W]|uniref:Uncharacterized protein n=1 Tax=Pelomonas dachongensis TaxID=3299029 RepID=A0ABW7EKZ9_9BURK
MRLAAILASIVALIISAAWLINTPGYEPAVAIAAALAALVSSFFLKRDDATGGQKQNLGDNSTGIQAGRDVNIRDFNQK